MIRPDILTAIAAEIEVAEVEQAADNLDVDGAHGLRAELTQVAACAIAWLSTLPVPTPEPNGIITSLPGEPVTYQHEWTFEHGVPITVEVVVKDQCCGYGSCGPDCLCVDAAMCVGTCSNPEHEGRGTE